MYSPLYLPPLEEEVTSGEKVKKGLKSLSLYVKPSDLSTDFQGAFLYRVVMYLGVYADT